MIIAAEAGAARRPQDHPLLRAMFEARKRVFVDLLQWNVPVLEGRFEIDQFDDEHAQYIIVGDSGGRHLASARLLKTTRPHLLDTLFPDLCDGPIPSGPSTLEITRFCLDRSLGAPLRLEARNMLVSALVAYGLANGIERYSGVAEVGWISQILAFGWDCQPLGLPRERQGKFVGALSISITPKTPALLARSNIFRDEPFDQFGFLKAA
jgi:acyl-homoserine lactone synthase